MHLRAIHLWASFVVFHGVYCEDIAGAYLIFDFSQQAYYPLRVRIADASMLDVGSLLILVQVNR